MTFFALPTASTPLCYDGVSLNPLQNPLDGFSPELYTAILSMVAHSDGLHSTERDILELELPRFDAVAEFRILFSMQLNIRLAEPVIRPQSTKIG